MGEGGKSGPEDVFEVEDILEHKLDDGKDFYLVKWKGFSDATWEPDENIGEELQDLKAAAKGRKATGKASEKGKKKDKKSKKEKKGRREKKRRQRQSSHSSSDSSSSDEKAKKKKRKGGSDEAAIQQQLLQQQLLQQQMMQQWQAQQQAVQYQRMQQWQYAQHMQAQAQYQQQQQAAQHHHMMMLQQEEEKNRLEEARRKEEEDQKRREEEQKRQAAKAVIMQAVENMRGATPETFDGLKKELDEVFARELKFTGTPLQQLIYEKEKSLEAARKSIEKIKIQRKIAQQAAVLEQASALVKAAAPAQKEFYKSKPSTPPSSLLASLQAAMSGTGPPS